MASRQSSPSDDGGAVVHMSRSASQDAEARQSRPRYKSWRKKYRKIRAHFDKELKDNMSMYRMEQKLEGIAQRLQEQNDQLLEMLLDLNSSLQIPDSLRYNMTANVTDMSHTAALDDANDRLMDARLVAENGKLSRDALSHIRDELEDRVSMVPALNLQAQEQAIMEMLELDDLSMVALDRVHDQCAYLTTDHEEDYLKRLDARLGLDKAWSSLSIPSSQTGRASDRDVELHNPQSVHNWLKAHKVAIDNDDRSDAGTPTSAARKGATGARNLARKVGDRALERARDRDDASPMAATREDANAEDELALMDAMASGSKKKKSRDPDEPYRPKGGSKTKPKRKRDDALDVTASGRKKHKTDGVEVDMVDGP